MAKSTKKVVKHELKGGTLYREDAGIIGRCRCGWTTGFRISSFIASVAFRDHQEDAASKEN